MSQRVKIKNFLKNLSVGDYKLAHDNLKTVVEDKLKAKIVKANKKRIF